MWKKLNINPCGELVGDCVVRAIGLLLGKSWDEVHNDLSRESFFACDMSNSNKVWAKYLEKFGYIGEQLAGNKTVSELAKVIQDRKYLLATSTHVVTVIDGDYYDTWDSGNIIPLFIWKEKSNMAYQNPYYPMNNGYQNNWQNTNGMNMGMSMNPSQQMMQPQQSYTPPQINPTMIFVDGENSARAYQIPPTHPVGQPFVLWDNNEQFIYFKTVDQFGRPNPLKRARYVIEDVERPLLPNSQQTSTAPDTSEFVTKSDFENLKQELLKAIHPNTNQNQNGSRNMQNNGGKN